MASHRYIRTCTDALLGLWPARAPAHIGNSPQSLPVPISVLDFVRSACMVYACMFVLCCCRHSCCWWTKFHIPCNATNVNHSINKPAYCCHTRNTYTSAPQYSHPSTFILWMCAVHWCLMSVCSCDRHGDDEDTHIPNKMYQLRCLPMSVGCWYIHIFICLRCGVQVVDWNRSVSIRLWLNGARRQWTEHSG